MRLLPEPGILRGDWIFSAVFFGEAFLLLASTFAAFSYAPWSVVLSSSLVVAVAARCFLLWAWGQRFACVDGFYLAWAAPGLIRDTLLVLQCLHFWASRGFGIQNGRISTGDSSIALWGTALLFSTVLTRLVGISWILFRRKLMAATTREGWPTFVLATITAFVIFSFLTTLFRAGPHAMLMTLLFIPQYGFTVFL